MAISLNVEQLSAFQELHLSLSQSVALSPHHPQINKTQLCSIIHPRERWRAIRKQILIELYFRFSKCFLIFLRLSTSNNKSESTLSSLNSQASQWTYKLLTIHMAAGLLSHNTLLVIASSSGSIDRWMDWSDRSRCSLSDCPKNPSNGSAVRVHTVNTVLICENSSQYLHGLR